MGGDGDVVGLRRYVSSENEERAPLRVAELGQPPRGIDDVGDTGGPSPAVW